MNELLSIQEVAQITQLHEITIRRYIRAGKLGAVRIGRRLRVPQEALDQLLEPVRSDAASLLSDEHAGQIGEAVAVYDAASPRNRAGLEAAIGGVALQLAQLPAEDIFSTVQFVTRLQQRHLDVRQQPLSPAEIVAAARQQAELLSGVPRAEVAARFAALAEEIRQQAAAQALAFDGDWLGD